MSTLTVYDAQGNEYSPSGGATGTNQRIKEMALASMRVAIKPDSRQVTGYFRAKETPNSRAEQFYGEYTDRSTAEPLADFVSAVRTQIDEWNHTLAESDDSMSVFKALTNQRRATVPGSEKDMRILEELVGGRAVTAVGVSSASDAVGLLQEFADQHSVAIADSTNTDALSEFDIVIVTGRHQGIEPVGQTTGRWKEAKQSIKRELVDEEISSITESVRTLKRDFGMSSGEIQRKVSGLEASSSGGRGGSQLGGSASTGEKIKQTLLSPEVGKYMFIGAIILIVLIGGLWGAGTFAQIGPFAESHVIGGKVVDQDGDPVSNAEVTITNASGGNVTVVGTDGNSVYPADTNENGQYSVKLADGDTTYDISYNNETYDSVEPTNTTIDFPKDQSESSSTESGGDSSGSPIPDWVPILGVSSEDDGSSGNDESGGNDEPENQSIPFVEGKVVNSENGEGIKFANVTALNQDNEEIPSTRNETDLEGNYRVEDIPSEAFGGDIDQGTLRLKAEKEGVIETGDGNNVIEIELDIRSPSEGIDSGTDIEVNEV